MPAPTLSKKQQKAQAFRQKKKGKPALDDVLDVPENDLDLDDVPAPPATGKRKRANDDKDEKSPAKSKSKDDGASKPAKKRKKNEDKDVADANGGDDETPAQDAAKKPKPKYILFLGNLRYTTTAEQIAKHFEACDPPPTIRLLTPKPKPGASAAKSKGCAFLEFKSHNTLQQALKLHGSELDGRKVNVELTAGGGGKSTARLDKVRERNKALTHERKQRLVKSATAPDENAAGEALKPQRHSNTSGADRAETVPQRKTWSVPEADEAAGRGGVKHKKRGKKGGAAKSWGSGANAIAME